MSSGGVDVSSTESQEVVTSVFFLFFFFVDESGRGDFQKAPKDG